MWKQGISGGQRDSQNINDATPSTPHCQLSKPESYAFYLCLAAAAAAAAAALTAWTTGH